jgi:hypothetical protein
MSGVNLSDADVYINGLTVNGDLKVKGILFMAHDTKNKDVIFNENTVFEGNLHVLPSSDLTITGSIVSGELRDRY